MGTLTNNFAAFVANKLTPSTKELAEEALNQREGYDITVNENGNTTVTDTFGNKAKVIAEIGRNEKGQYTSVIDGKNLDPTYNANIVKRVLEATVDIA